MILFFCVLSHVLRVLSVFQIGLEVGARLMSFDGSASCAVVVILSASLCVPSNKTQGVNLSRRNPFYSLR